MEKIVRCNRCFAPLDNVDKECRFCGLDPKEERIARDFIFEEEPLPEGLTLDEEIAFFSRRANARQHGGFGYGK